VKSAVTEKNVQVSYLNISNIIQNIKYISRFLPQILKAFWSLGWYKSERHLSPQGEWLHGKTE